MSDLQSDVIRENVLKATERRGDAAVALQAMMWLSAQLIQLVESSPEAPRCFRDALWSHLEQAVLLMENSPRE